MKASEKPVTKTARPHVSSPLSRKVSLMVGAAALLIAVLACIVGYTAYTSAMNERFISQAQGVAELVVSAVDGDKVDEYLDTLKTDDDYWASKIKLTKLQKAFSDVEFIYVYQVREDGCHVVFDLDTEEVTGGKLGEVWEVEAAFVPYMQRFLEGGSVPPQQSNDRYGWLLTVHEPIYNTAGRCVAYAAVDVKMYSIITDRQQFLIGILLLSLLATGGIVFVFTRFFDRKIVMPINRLALTTGELAASTGEDSRALNQKLIDLNIRSRDEVQNLYESIKKMVSDLLAYVDLLKEKNAEIERMQNNVIASFADMIESRDENTGRHVRHTSAYVRALGTELLSRGEFPEVLTPAYLEDLCMSAPLHDIGKIKVPDAILNKPGRLTPEEFDTIKEHTTAGSHILREALDGVEDENYLMVAEQVAHYHHKRWSGDGYPEGICGDTIPLAARVMAVADVFDALVSRRSYKEPMTFDEAFDIIERESGSHFDPAVAAAFIAIRPQIEAIALEENSGDEADKA